MGNLYGPKYVTSTQFVSKVCLQLRAEPLIHRPDQRSCQTRGAVRTLVLEPLEVIRASLQYLQSTCWQQEEQNSPNQKRILQTEE